MKYTEKFVQDLVIAVVQSGQIQLAGTDQSSIDDFAQQVLRLSEQLGLRFEVEKARDS